MCSAGDTRGVARSLDRFLLRYSVGGHGLSARHNKGSATPRPIHFLHIPTYITATSPYNPDFSRLINHFHNDTFLFPKKNYSFLTSKTKSFRGNSLKGRYRWFRIHSTSTFDLWVAITKAYAKCKENRLKMVPNHPAGLCRALMKKANVETKFLLQPLNFNTKEFSTLYYTLKITSQGCFEGMGSFWEL